jgi:hypothetical protein
MAVELRQYIRSKNWRPVLEFIDKFVDKVSETTGKTKRKKETWVKLGRAPRVGVVVSNGFGSVGWSLLHEPDTYDPRMAIRLARGIEENEEKLDYSEIPYSIHKDIKKMLERSKKYFKQ